MDFTYQKTNYILGKAETVVPIKEKDMIIAFDTYYYENKAKTIGVGFNSWEADKPNEIYSEIIEGIAAYEPGLFFKREMPCILSLLNKINLNEVEIIVIDGYVILDDEGKFGLGGHLYEKLNEKIPIIGVAKSGFHSNKLNTKALLRGDSKKPLYVSSIGIDLELAFQHIRSMHGNYRIPTLLQIMDSKTKDKKGCN